MEDHMDIKFHSFRWLSALVLLLTLTSCGGGGGGGADPDPFPIDPVFSGGEGTVAQPVAVTLNTPRSSTVGAFDDSYYQFSTTTAGTYVLTLSNPTTDVSWDLYSNSDFTGDVESCDDYWSTSTEKCSATLQANKMYYLRVSEFSMSFSNGTFTLLIQQITNEGSTTAPIELTVGTPHSGSVGLSGISYYRFVPSKTVAHTISISNSVPSYSWLTIKVFSTDFASASPDLLKSCNSYNPICTVNGLSSGSNYYVEVDGSTYSAVQYSITVTEGVSEGSLATPLELLVSEPTHTGAVDASSTSYYQFTTTENAGEYILSLSGTTGVYITVYSGADFSTGSLGSCSPGTPCRIYGLDSKTTYYVKVSNSTTGSLTYQIGVSEGTTEGSVNDPVLLMVDAAAHNAVADSSGAAYYSFQTTSTSGSYTISLSNTQKNLGWTLSDNAAFSTTISSCNNVTTTGVGDESCATTNLDSNKMYYLKVLNYEATGSSTYAVAVVTGGGSEGSKNNPISLATGTSHSGGVIRYGYSYYTFTTGSSAMTHIISLTNMQSDLSWTLYSDAAFSSSVRYCSTTYGIGDEICSTQGTYTPVLNANTTYYLRVDNNYSSGVYSTYDIKVTALDPAAGCSSGSECYDFEGGVATPFILTTSVTQGNKSATLWRLDSTLSGTGTTSMKSGSLSAYDSACVELTKTVSTSSILFSVRTSTDNYNDLYFYINGSMTAGANWYGTTPWRRVLFDTTNLIGSSHTFQWCYSKSTAVITGADAAWVDDIEFK
jgi:hypothetical protein